MAKDRFSNQKKSNYSKEFRWGNSEYTAPVKRGLILSTQQKEFIKNIIENYRNNLNTWEWDFMNSLYNSARYSETQKFYLEKIVKKLGNNKK
jgi:hypothetical protein